MTSLRLTFLVVVSHFIPFASAYSREEAVSRFGKLNVTTNETDSLKRRLFFRGKPEVRTHLQLSKKLEPRSQRPK